MCTCASAPPALLPPEIAVERTEEGCLRAVATTASEKGGVRATLVLKLEELCKEE